MFGANACMEQEARLQGELPLLLSLCSVLKDAVAVPSRIHNNTQETSFALHVACSTR